MEELRTRLEDVVDAHGPWTAMSIKLSDDVYTREPAVDHRLKRILQACSDVVGKPLAACRVLDLACLEGHYALEFARHGSEVVGIEGRLASVAKCDFARDAIGPRASELPSGRRAQSLGREVRRLRHRHLLRPALSPAGAGCLAR